MSTEHRLGIGQSIDHLLRINKFLEISLSTAFQARAVTGRLLCLQRLENAVQSRYKAKIKYMSVSGYVLKKIRVGRSEKYFILFFHFILKW